MQGVGCNLGDFGGSNSLKFVSKGEQMNDEEGRLMEFFIESPEWTGSKPGCVSLGLVGFINGSSP